MMSALSARKQSTQIAPRAPLNTQPCLKTTAVWLGVYFPDIALEAHQAASDTPFVVLTLIKGKACVYRANQLAKAQGIEPNMPLNAAYAVCKNLSVSQRDETAEAACLERYAHISARFTPHIVLSKPGALLLEVKQSLHLFGGLRRLHHQLTTVIDVPHKIACAPTAEAAELMARNDVEKVVREPGRLQSALGDLPVCATPLKLKLVEPLARCGVHCLRDIWRLARHDLARRFGPELLEYMDLLSGQIIRPRVFFEPAVSFYTRYDFEQETDSIEHVLHAVELLLKQAQQFLQIRASISEKITFDLIYTHRQHEPKKWLRLSVHAQQGGDTPAHFLPQMSEQLQRLRFDQPVIALTLCIDAFKPRVDSTQDLFKRTVPATKDWPALLNLLCARLGFERVYRLQRLADHRPEKSWQKEELSALKKNNQAALNTPARPVWLFHQPVKCLGQRYQLVSDAERLEAGWWDGEDQRREYYQGIAPSGRRCWLFRDLQATNGQWYVHGLFA